jgi:hypothetical protein
MNIHQPFSSRTIILTGLITIPITLILILFSPNTPAIETSDPNFTVDNLNKIDSKRVSRTDYEYTYQADITNTGTDAENVTATVSSSSPGTTIVEDNLTFGTVATGTTATSSDTFTIRQNRRVPFDPDALGFEVDSTLIDDGLEWPVFENEEIGYSLKYPPNFEVTLQKGTEVLTLEDEHYIVSISIEENPDGLSIEDYFDGSPGPDLNNFSGFGPKTIEANGYSALKFFPSACQCNSVVVIERGQDFIVINNLGVDSMGVFNVIIQSFTFF